MARSIPTTEPVSFAAGETVDWTRTVGDYTAAEGYTLKAYFAGPDVFTVTATVDDAGWLFEIPASTTATKAPGTYQWRIYAETGTGDSLERYLVTTGTAVLTANVTTAAAGDVVSFAESMVAALKARLAARTAQGADLEKYGLAGRQVEKIPFQQLRQELANWQQALWRERNPGKFAPKVSVSFD